MEITMNTLHDVDSASDVAIIGMACRVPGARNLAEFWQNLCAGRESLSFFSAQELVSAGIDPVLLAARNYVKAGAVLEDIDLFDAAFFGLTPREAESMDPQHRIFLECAWEALEHAGYNPHVYQGRIGIYAGVGVNTYLSPASYDAASAADLFQLAVGNEKEHLATHTAYKLNLKGPGVSVSTACSTSLVAVHLACQSLLNGECDMFLAGAVSARAVQKTGYFYQQEGILSPDGHCRAFDARAQGTVPGNGVGVVALKRLDRALADGDCIHAVIKGSAMNNDGALKIGYTAPSVQGQTDVIAEAQAVAGIEPEQISYIEAHGTGTPLGDTIEMTALTKVFRARTQKTGFCAIGSVKTNIGHLDTASGVVGLLKTVLALKHRLLPPSLHFEHPNPAIDFAHSPFSVQSTLSEWKSDGAPRRAGVSSFGLGGTNVHLILEEAPAAATPAGARPWQILALSARTDSALESMTHNLIEHLKEQPTLELADVAYTLQVGRKPFACRQVAVCRDIDDALHVLSGADPARLLRASPQTSAGQLAFLFPGVGDHYVCMAWGLYQAEARFRAQVDRCAVLLQPHLGLDIRDVIYPGLWRTPQQAGETADPAPTFDLRQLLGRAGQESDPASSLLNATRVAQPAVFVIEYALARLWIEWVGQPAAMIGYSLGEYVAACLAGVFSLEEALFLVARRAQLIDTLPAGAMLAVPLPEDDVRTLLGEQLSIAAVNMPALCVVSGPVSASAELEQHLAQAGITCRRLQTAHAFHSKMMLPIVDSLLALFRMVKLRPPTLPYLSNVTGTWMTPELATDPAYWARHLCQEVRFAQCVRELFSVSQPLVLEVGPGQTLGSFVLQSAEPSASERIVFASLRSTFSRQTDMAFLLSTLGKLWLVGREVDWAQSSTGEERTRLPLPTYPFERQRYWTERHTEAAARPAHRSQAKRPEIAEWLYLPSWERSLSPLPACAVQKQRWLIFVDQWGIGSQIVGRLSEQGQDVVSVLIGETFRKVADTTYTLSPGEKAGYDALLADLAASHALPGRIVHCWSLGPAQVQLPVSAEHFQATQQTGLYSLIFLAQALAKQHLSDPLQMRVLSNQLHDLEHSDWIDPARATILAPCKVIAQEYTNISCQSLEIVLPQPGSQQESQVLEQLLRELHAPLCEPVIAYRGSYRWTQAFTALPLQDHGTPARLRQAGVYLLVGGLGAIGFSLARWLAQRVQARLVLTGRSALPPEAEWEHWLATHERGERTGIRIQRVQELQKMGAEVLVMHADAASVSEMQGVIDETLRRFGTLNGVISAAGVESDKNLWPLQAVDEAACELHFQPKVSGTLVLEDVLSQHRIDFCLLLSSLSTVLGGLQFTPYAAANMFLDAYAHLHNQEHPTPWISVDWDGAATPQETVDAIGRILSLQVVERVVVSTGDLYARLDQWIVPTSAQEQEQKRGSAAPQYPRPHLQNAYVAPRSQLEETLAEIWQDLLGIAQVGVHDHFLMLGGHSLLATRIVTRLRKVFQVDVPLRSFLETPTIAELAVVIEQIQSQQLSPAVPLLLGTRPHNLPLSFAQQRLWFLDQLEPGSIAYAIPAVIQWLGVLDVQALEHSLRGIVQRHEILRTTFGLNDGQPVQQIGAAWPGELPLADLSGLRPQAAASELQRLKLQQVHQPFDLARGPLLRIILLRLHQQKHALSLVLNHIVADGWSMGLLVRELSAFYQAALQREAVSLPALPIQYADYALWQRRWLQGELLERQLSYWKQQLAGQQPLELPTDHPRPALRTYNGALQSQVLPAPLVAALVALSQSLDVTLFMLLLTAFKVLLLRYSGLRDLSVGTPIANRTQAEVEGLIGFFVNTLVLRTDLSGNTTFEQAVRTVSSVCLDAYAHQDIPFEKVVEEISPQRDMSRSPLFQVMFVLQNNDLESFEPVKGVYIEPQAPVGMEFAPAFTSKFDLTLTLIQSEQGLHSLLEYSTDLFETETIRRLLGHWQILLESIVHNPQAHLHDLHVLTPDEWEQVLAQGKRAPSELPVDACLHELVERQVDLTPDAIAVVFAEQQLTYRQLNTQAQRLANLLQARGSGPDQLVGVYLERSVDVIIALFAVLKAGGAYLPLDPQLPPARLLALCEDAHLSLVLTRAQLLESIPGLAASQIQVLCLDEDLSCDSQQLCLAQRPVPANLAYMIYTSGSTGKPKGVMLTHANAVRLFTTTSPYFHFQASDSWTFFHSAAFDFSVWEIWGCLLTGGRLVVVPYWLSRSPDEFYHHLVEQQVTILNQTPSAFRQLIAAESIEGELALRLVIFGGEALDPCSLRPWFARHGDQHPELVNMYGITETTVHVTYRPLACSDGECQQGSVIGFALGDLQCYVLDAYRQAVPVGVPGELYVGGEGLARGYWQRADITAERFVPHPFSQTPGARLYRTGDLVRTRASGELEYLGRIDQQVKLRGFRIELGEIEATLVQHPAVREAVVLAREDPPGEKRLVAYLVPEAAQASMIAELRTYLQGQLPAYMLPASIVLLDALPLSVNGKVDRKALPVPQVVLEGEQDVDHTESTPLEELIAGCYALVLGYTAIGVDDNFFALGGHSLQATQVISRIRTLFQVEIPLRTLFETPTVAQLATAVRQALLHTQGLALPPLQAGARDQRLPLSFAQQRLWLLDQLEPDPVAYTMPITVRLLGCLHAAVLQRCLQEIITRHESLRTVFLQQDGRPWQAQRAFLPFALPVIDLRSISAEQRERTIVLLAREEMRSPFDLSRGPLIRGKLLRIAEQESVFMLTMHHIVTDAWSLGVMVRELAALYEAFVQGQPSPLAPLPVQYADFALWQHSWLQGAVSETLLDYWKKQLQGAAPLLLPTDRPASPVARSHGATYLFSLPAELVQALVALGRQEQATLFMTLLAGFQTLIYRYTGQVDSVVGTDIAGRVQEAVEGLIGFFVNLLVLRTDLGGNPSFRELLARVRETVLQAYMHQDLPFEKLVDALHIERSSHQLPLVRALFVLQNAPLPPLELPGITMQPLNIDPETAKFDLAAFLWEEAQTLSGMINYRTDVFDASTIQTLVRRFETVLQAMVSQPEAAVDAFTLFTQEELRQRAQQDAAEHADQRRKLKLARRKEIGLSALQEAEK